jgi:hypothetical protein
MNQNKQDSSGVNRVHVLSSIVTSGLNELRRRYDEEALRLAADVLGEFVDDQAARTREQVGFGWVAAADAPSDCTTLRTAFDRSVTTGAPLPISSENNQDIIYGSAEQNVRFRFWHDVSHCRRRLSFELPDELELALWHLGELEREGFGPDTLVWKLLRADLVGQTHVMAFARRFPLDQRRFVEGCITSGYDAGLLVELRRGASDAIDSTDTGASS